MYKQLLILISVCIVATGLRADLSVSYQPFHPDEIVIEFGRWKMTAKHLSQYGLEPVKIAIANQGADEAVFTPDISCISTENVCQKLKSSLMTVGLKSLLAGCISAPIVTACIYIVAGVHLIRPNKDENLTAYNNRLSLALIKEFPQTSHFLSIVAPLFLCSYAIGSVGMAHQYNQDLSAWCNKNLISSAVVIQPQQQITKLLFVAANTSKHIFNPVGMCAKNS